MRVVVRVKMWVIARMPVMSVTVPNRCHLMMRSEVMRPKREEVPREKRQPKEDDLEGVASA